MKKCAWLVTISLLVVLLAACGGGGNEADTTAADSAQATREAAPVPEEYAGLENPLTGDTAAIERGADTYKGSCSTCHGDQGKGDGPAGTVLQPPATDLATASPSLPDDYLFWRISEGGMQLPFNSAMPAWKNVLSEDERWEVVSFLRSLEAK